LLTVCTSPPPPSLSLLFVIHTPLRITDPNDDVNWRQATDPSSGRPYYYNKITKQTVWEDPRTDKSTPAPSRQKTITNNAAVAAASQVASAAAPAAASASSSSVMASLRADSSDDLKGNSGNSDDAFIRQDSAPISAAQGRTLANITSDAKHLQKKHGVDQATKANFRDMFNSDDDEEEDENIAFLFAKHRKGWVNRTFRTGHILDNSEIMSFKKSLIKKALLKQNRHLDSEAVQCFKSTCVVIAVGGGCCCGIVVVVVCAVTRLSLPLPQLTSA
jgi:WW domain